MPARDAEERTASGKLFQTEVTALEKVLWDGLFPTPLSVSCGQWRNAFPHFSMAMLIASRSFAPCPFSGDLILSIDQVVFL